MYKRQDEDMFHDVHVLTHEQVVQGEMDKYRWLELKKGEDPLPFWRRNAGALPVLETLARRYLCVQATSVASERVFSTAGDIVTHGRSRIAPELVDDLIFLKKNCPFLPL